MQKPLFPALLFALLLAFGCGKSDDTPDNAGAWTIAHYMGVDDKTDASVLFTGYSFEFNANDEMVIHLPGGSTKPAKWALDAGQTKLVIGMEDPFAPVSALVGEWDVKEYTASSIRLEKTPVIGPAPTGEGLEVHFVKQ